MAQAVRNLTETVYVGEPNKSWAERASDLRSRLTPAAAAEPRALQDGVRGFSGSLKCQLVVCKTCRNHLHRANV